MFLLACSPFRLCVFGQDADSTTAVVDSLARMESLDDMSADSVQSDETPAVQTLELLDPPPGGLEVGIDVFPPVHYALEITEQLSTIPGSFAYDLSTPGWPSFWTLRGRSPLAIDVSWDGFAFDELFTGRPAFEFLPRGLLDTLGSNWGTASSPLVNATTRPVSSDAPLTELAYRTSNKGMQYVYASHSQQRQRNLFGHPGRIGIRAGYLGQKADGEYPGSKLERARGVLASTSVRSGRVGFEISNLASRRRVGAHGGVIATNPGDPNSIYQRFGAIVIDQSAERRLIRNDLTVRTSLGFSDDITAVLSTRWTKQLFRFRSSSDTLSLRSQRSGARLDVLYNTGSVRLGGHLKASNEWITDHSFLTGSLKDLARYSGRLSASLEGPYAFSVSAGINSLSDRTSHDLALSGSADWGLASIGISIARSVPDPALIESFGFGQFATVDANAAGYLNDGRVELKIRARPFLLSVAPFVLVDENPREWIGTVNPDSIVFAAVQTDRQTIGMNVLLGFRLDASRGLYASFDATTLSRSFTGSADPDGRLRRWTEVGPDRYATATVGLRYLLFKGDLDGNLYVRSRLWPDFTGYAFHRQTGLAVLPRADDANPVSASAALDLIIEAGVRGATVFLSYENLLSGTDVIVGNQLVAGYPLAQRRLRFGAYWPILN